MLKSESGPKLIYAQGHKLYCFIEQEQRLMTNGTKLSLAIASCVDEQLSWCTLPLAVTGGDVTTLLSIVGVGRDTSSIAEEISRRRSIAEVADGLLAGLLIADGVEAMIKVAPWNDELTSVVIVLVVVVVLVAIAKVLSDELAASETDDDDDVAWDAVTGDKQTLETVDDDKRTLERVDDEDVTSGLIENDERTLETIDDDEVMSNIVDDDDVTPETNDDNDAKPDSWGR